MRVEGRYPRFNESATGTNSAATPALLAASQTDLYVFIDTLTVSVYLAATGGGGLCQILDGDDAVLYTMNVDALKDVSLDFGMGLNVGKGVSLSIKLSGAVTNEASVFVVATGHYSGKGE